MARRRVTARSDGRYIAIALGLIAGFLVFEVIMAFAGHSLALLAEAGHMLTDAGALGASLLAIRLARRPASGAWTFGFKRAEVLSAQANGITLLVISALVAFEAMSRLIRPLPVTGGIVVTIAAVGVADSPPGSWPGPTAAPSTSARSRTSSPTCTGSSARWSRGS